MADGIWYLVFRECTPLRVHGACTGTLLVIDVLSELLGHAGEVAGVDPGGVVNTFSMSSRESFSSILRVIMARNSAKSVHDGAVAIAIKGAVRLASTVMV